MVITMLALTVFTVTSMIPNIHFENSEEGSEETAKTDTSHMWGHVASIGISVAFLSFVSKVYESCTNNVGSWVHKKEEGPYYKE